MKPMVATYQVQWELDHLLDLVENTIRPGRILEIGSYEGGTLWHWLQVADLVVAVDDACRNKDEWLNWADDTGADLHVVHGSSHDPDIIKRVLALGPFDMVFIDGDHTYDGALQDFVSYLPMVAESGCVVFHDILPRPDYGVAEVWASVKDTLGARWVEIAQNRVEAGNEGRCGIGVAWL